MHRSRQEEEEEEDRTQEQFVFYPNDRASIVVAVSLLFIFLEAKLFPNRNLSIYVYMCVCAFLECEVGRRLGDVQVHFKRLASAESRVSSQIRGSAAHVLQGPNTINFVDNISLIACLFAFYW